MEKSEKGKEIAMTHTGALTGSEALHDAMFERLGKMLRHPNYIRHPMHRHECPFKEKGIPTFYYIIKCILDLTPL